MHLKDKNTEFQGDSYQNFSCSNFGYSEILEFRFSHLGNYFGFHDKMNFPQITRKSLSTNPATIFTSRDTPVVTNFTYVTRDSESRDRMLHHCLILAWLIIGEGNTYRVLPDVLCSELRKVPVMKALRKLEKSIFEIFV